MWESGDITSHILNFDSRWRLIANFTLRLLFSEEIYTVLIVQGAMWAPEII
jgi:hypothetical protein